MAYRILSTTVISHSSCVKSLEENMGQLIALVHGNTSENSKSDGNENQRDPIKVSAVVTRS